LATYSAKFVIITVKWGARTPMGVDTLAELQPGDKAEVKVGSE
jgi:hypothetical protein